MDIIRKIKELLATADFSEEEILFYINTLKKPNSTIYDLAKRSKIPKDRAYKIFDKLAEQKLLKSSDQFKNKKISALPLRSFIESVKSEGRKLFKTADSLKEISPYLNFLSLPEQKIEFTTYNENELAERFIDMGYLDFDSVLAYGTFEDFVPMMGIASDQKFVKVRLKKGKKCFPVLANPGEYSFEIAGKDYQENRKTRLIYDEKLKNYFVILFPGSSTISFWLKNPDGGMSGALIESKILSTIHRRFYDHFRDLADSNSFRKSEK